MDALLQVECVTSSQNIRTLRRLFDNISSHVCSLKSLGLEPESYGSLLCPVLITNCKLPADLQLIVSCKVSGTDWKLEIIARERLGVNMQLDAPYILGKVCRQRVHNLHSHLIGW